MNVHYDINDLPNFRNAVITIGSFDGVHHGHQRILSRVKQLAGNIGGESVVITFYPHPRLVIYPKDDSLRLLTTIEEKVALLKRTGVDHIVIVPFTIEFSQQSADEYIEKFLLAKFRPKFIVIGYDHRFGLNRKGDVNFLKWYGNQHGYKVIEIPKQEVEDIAVSSSKIRQALEKGDVLTASKFLHHYFTLQGKVVEGQHIGRTIGFPTANIEILNKYKLIPPYGVYASYTIHKGKRYQSMLYIGDRPTLSEYNHRTIEVNIFDFDQEIYGDFLTVELVGFIRKDMQFQDLEKLKEQLKMDKSDVLHFFEESKKKSQSQAQSQEDPKKPAVALVILNYNGKQHLETFLPGVLNSSYSNLKIYVADNGSTDGSLQYLRSHFPNIIILEMDQNNGFAQGYNLALSQLVADYFILLNSDIQVGDNWIDPLIEKLEGDSTVAVVQPKILDLKNRSFFEYAGAAGGWLDFLGYPFCRGRIFDVNERDTGQYDDVQEIFWASGAAFVIRADLFMNIGGFDEAYFAHSEEIDLCWRIKKAGYKVLSVPESTVYHLGGGTLNYLKPQKAYLNFRNSLFTLLKNEPLPKLLWLLPLRTLLDGLAMALFISQGKIKHLWAVLRAHGSFYWNFGQMVGKRQHYNQLIAQNRLAPRSNKQGIYYGSIVWDFFVRKKKYFKDLDI